jgi:hypothetical protein
MRSIRYLNIVLTLIAVLLTLQLWTTWMGSPDLASRSYAQGIPDGGAQRAQIVDQLKLLNQKTDQVKELLVSGKVRVVVENPAQRDDD